ncbi:MAG: nucleotidyltransferase family protein [Luminiphilus sp.]|nr:nucleotidyltransferase family protein [Luminiphilus sp.]
MKAMILAAGLGKRMLPLTQNTPKPLLKVAGRPLLEHHILNLKAAGFTELVVNAAYLAQQIVDFCGDGRRWGVKIHVSVEAQPLETAGGIVKAMPFLGNKPFIVVNSDIYSHFPLKILQKCSPSIGGAHLVLVPNPPHNTVGDFSLVEQQVQPLTQPSLTFSGIGAYHIDFFSGLAQGRRPLKPLLDAAIANQSVTGEFYEGPWADIGTPQRLQALNERPMNWEAVR